MAAQVRTPLLASQMAGPAVMVSHGNAKFPDLVIVLQAEGVRIDLVGSASIDKAGVTRVNFASLPANGAVVNRRLPISVSGCKRKRTR